MRADQAIDREHQIAQDIFQKLRLRMRPVDVQKFEFSRQGILISHHDRVDRREEIAQLRKLTNPGENDPGLASLCVRDEWNVAPGPIAIVRQKTVAICLLYTRAGGDMTEPETARLT